MFDAVFSQQFRATWAGTERGENTAGQMGDTLMESH
jgi:hypothetical protein